MKKAKIKRVWIEKKVDESPDTSYLGEYSSQPAENAIDRQERGDMERNQHRYFNPAQHHNTDEWDSLTDLQVLQAYEKEIARGHQELSRDAMCEALMCEALNANYREQDYKRMESLNAGHWCYLGIIAKAEVRSVSGISQTLRSGGLWGVESDSDNNHLDSIAKEELDGLQTELLNFGFSVRQIKRAFANVETRD